jgi:hypothetical protein
MTFCFCINGRCLTPTRYTKCSAIRKILFYVLSVDSGVGSDLRQRSMTSPVQVQPPSYDEVLGETWSPDQAAAAADAEYDSIELTFVEGKTVPDGDADEVDLSGAEANQAELPTQGTNEMCQPESLSKQNVNTSRHSINYHPVFLQLSPVV